MLMKNNDPGDLLSDCDGVYCIVNDMIHCPLFRTDRLKYGMWVSNKLVISLHIKTSRDVLLLLMKCIEQLNQGDGKVINDA